MAVLKPFLPTKKEDKVLAAFKRYMQARQSILAKSKQQMKTKKTIVKKCVIPPNDLTGIDLSKIKKFCTNGSCGCNSLKEKVQNLRVFPNPFSTGDIQRYYQELVSQELAQQNQLQKIGGLAQIQSITTGGTEANKPF